MSGLPRVTVMAALALLLTSLSLRPALDGLAWLPPVVLCVVAVAATGYVARRCHVPQLLIPLVEAAALTLVLVERFAHAQTIAGVLPGHGALAETRLLWDDGTHTIAAFGPPAPVTPGLMFVLAAALGLVAVAVDTIAVTYRSPAMAGLPLLVLYAVPAAVVTHGVPWAYFGIAAAGWLGLLLADGTQRLGGWGRRLGTSTLAGEAIRTRQPSTVGRRIGFASVLVAILVPALIPGLGAASFGHSFGDGDGGDGGTVNTVNPFVSLGSALNRPDDGTVLTYVTDDPNPDYLHLVTLDSFDGRNWVPSELESSGHLVDVGQLPPATGLTSTPLPATVTTTVTLDGLTRSTWLPVPYPVTSVRVDGDSGRWLWDRTNLVIWSADTHVEHLSYTATSAKVQPSVEQLEAAPPADPSLTGPMTAYPGTVPTTVIDVAQAIVATAKNPYEQAVALEGFFRDPANQFTYSTRVPDPGQVDPLSAFLESRTGFCQQYAATFAVMARIVGLPTRVVVGFVPGDQTAPNTWSVSWHDTHAWPEVFFEGVGWVRFEPTPSTNLGVTVPPYVTTDQGPPDDGGTSVTQPLKSESGASPSPSLRAPKDGDPSTSATRSSTSRVPWAWVLVPALVIAVLLVPWAARVRQRRGRYARGQRGDPRTAVAAVWEELVATCVDLDLAWPASRTPRQVAAALIAAADLDRTDDPAGRPAAESLRRLCVTTERARYARTTDSTPELVADIRCVRAGLMASAGRLTRLRATFAPASLVAQVGALAGDTIDWVDAHVQDSFSAIPDWRRRRDLAGQEEGSLTAGRRG